MRGILALSLVAPSVAFLAPLNLPRSRDMSMRAEQTSSRREMIEKTMGLAGMLGLVAVGGAAPVRAGWLNADSLPEVIKPDDVERDQDVLRSSDVQNELKSIKAYRSGIAGLRSELASNSQSDLYSRVRKELDVAAIRDSLNKVNSVFSEDSQRGTDRLVRIILQDVNELESAARQRPGTPRSDKKVTFINRKLKKLEGAFDELLTYF